MTKNKVIGLLVLLCVVLSVFLSKEHSAYKQQTERISSEFLSVQREACVALKAGDYDSFLKLAHKYEEISRVYERDYGGWKATEVFFDEAYFNEAEDDRAVVADMIASSETVPEEEKSDIILNAVNTAYRLYQDYRQSE